MQIKDQAWVGVYPDLSGGEQFHTLTSESKTMDTSDLAAYFAEEGDPKVCGAAQSFADNKANIEKLCSETGKCDYETKQALTRFFSNLAQFQTHAQGVTQ